MTTTTSHRTASCPPWCSTHYVSEHPCDEQHNGVIELGRRGYEVSIAQLVTDASPVAFLDTRPCDDLTAEDLRKLAGALIAAARVLDGIEQGDAA